MPAQSEIMKSVQESAAKKILYLPHAVRQMSRPDRMITAGDVRKAVQAGQFVEDYPEDTRGHSCLILGFGVDGAPIHVVCSAKGDYLAIITAYLPSLDEWEAGFKKRKQQ